MVHGALEGVKPLPLPEWIDCVDLAGMVGLICDGAVTHHYCRTALFPAMLKVAERLRVRTPAATVLWALREIEK